jgi:hypothetical protein
MKMLKVHQNAPTSILKSQNFSGVIPRTPVLKGEGRGGEGVREGRGTEGRGKEGRGRSCVRLGREGIGVWPTQKLSCGAPYDIDVPSPICYH